MIFSAARWPTCIPSCERPAGPRDERNKMQTAELNQNGNRFGASLAPIAADWRQRFIGHRKIAIVAKAPDTVRLAPWNDASWSKWILNDMASLNEAPNWDACFEVHENAITSASCGTIHSQWLRKQHGKPIVTNRSHADMPDCVPLPVDEIVNTFGRYVTNTVSWMLATAILLQPDEIGLWGVNMAQDGEYAYQRNNLEFFCGVAFRAGIKITIPDGCDILTAPFLYGVDGERMLGKMKVRRAELEQRLSQARANETHWTTQRIATEGMLGELRYWHMYSGAAD